MVKTFIGSSEFYENKACRLDNGSTLGHLLKTLRRMMTDTIRKRLMMLKCWWMESTYSFEGVNEVSGDHCLANNFDYGSICLYN